MRCPGNSLKGVVVHLAPREDDQGHETVSTSTSSSEEPPTFEDIASTTHHKSELEVSRAQPEEDRFPVLEAGSTTSLYENPEPYEELETPPAYDHPPSYSPTFPFDARDKYHYSLAQRDSWALHEPNRDGSPHWDNLTRKDPSVLKESRQVKKYRKVREKLESQAAKEKSKQTMKAQKEEMERVKAMDRVGLGSQRW